MKLKNVYSIVAIIFLIVGAALWKLNATYRAEKTALKQNQLQTQLTALRSSLVSQISQLRNTLSTYTLQIDEAKINWVQLKPFYALAVVQEDAMNRLTVNKVFTQSGSVADRWNATGLQQNLSARVAGNQLLRAQVFKDNNELKHLALIVFDREKRNNQSRTGVMVVGDVSYFQRFFDLQRTSSITQVLLTNDKVVAAHSEYDYVGNSSDEAKISADQFFVDKQEMRGTNLTLLSYSSKRASSTLDIPLPILGIIVGLGFLMSGILLFVVKPNTEVAAVEVPDKITSIVTPQEITAAQTAVALAPVRRPLQTQNVETNKAPSKDVPLVFDHEPQIVPIQIQACVQQALFNLDRHFKNSAIVINKEFVAVGSVTLDYPKFIKIFENILLNLHQELAGSAKKKIYIRSYDKDSNIFLEFQASVARFNLPDLIITELTKVGAEYSLTNSSAGDPVVKFIFARSPVVTEPVKAAGFATPTAEALSGNVNITAQSGVDLEKIAQPDSDLDIDALLSLDDEAETGAPVEVDSNLKLDLAKEMQPTKFKLEDKLSIVEDPELNVELAARAQADQIKVKIRRPEKG